MLIFVDRIDFSIVDDLYPYRGSHYYLLNLNGLIRFKYKLNK